MKKKTKLILLSSLVFVTIILGTIYYIQSTFSNSNVSVGDRIKINDINITNDNGTYTYNGEIVALDDVDLKHIKINVKDTNSNLVCTLIGYVGKELLAGDKFTIKASTDTELKSEYTYEYEAIIKEDTSLFTITYNLNGGVNNPNNPSSYKLSTKTFNILPPTRDGYEFIGWTESEEDAPTLTITIPKGSSGDKNYTANWVKLDVTLAGLYDANDNLICEWDDCGLDVENDYTYNSTYFNSTTNPYYKLNNTYSNAAKMIISGNITKIGNNAFRDIKYIKDVIILDGVISIGEYAFSWGSFETISLPESITSIGEHAFEENTNLITINIPKNITTISDSMFYFSSKLSNITIPSEVTRIGNNSFQGTAISNITIPSKVTIIGGAAFAQCSNLTSITIPSSVVKIESFNFYESTNLNYVTFVSPENWYVRTGNSSTPLSTIDLQNTTTAATYLKDTYSFYDWEKKS